MTDEEKAKEYVKEKIKDMKVGNFKLLEIAHLSNGADIYNPKVEHLLNDRIKQAYLDGLAEGRKEKFEQVSARHKAELQEVNEQNDKLYEENKELKAQVENLEKALKALPQLHDDAVAELAELKAQINKMKHCSNCKFALLDESNFFQCKKGSFWQFCGGQGCEEWECKE